MPEEVTRMIASVGCSIAGSGTVSTRTSRVPCQVSAFMWSRYPAAPLAHMGSVHAHQEAPRAGAVDVHEVGPRVLEHRRGAGAHADGRQDAGGDDTAARLVAADREQPPPPDGRRQL